MIPHLERNVAVYIALVAMFAVVAITLIASLIQLEVIYLLTELNLNKNPILVFFLEATLIMLGFGIVSYFIIKKLALKYNK